MAVQARDSDVSGVDETGLTPSNSATSCPSRPSFIPVSGPQHMATHYLVTSRTLSQQTPESEEEKTMRGIAESFQPMVDSYLCAFASAQLMIANDTLNVPAIGLKRPFVIGHEAYIYSITALNLLVPLVFLTATLISNFWTDLPRCGFRDIKSLVIGTSIGGNVVGSLALDAHWRRRTSWVGDASDKVVGEIKVFMRTGGRLALVAGQRQDELWEGNSRIRC